MFGFTVIVPGRFRPPFIVGVGQHRPFLVHKIENSGGARIGGVCGLTFARRRLETAEEYLASTDPGAPCGVSDGRWAAVEAWREGVMELGGSMESTYADPTY